MRGTRVRQRGAFWIAVALAVMLLGAAGCSVLASEEATNDTGVAVSPSIAPAEEQRGVAGAGSDAYYSGSDEALVAGESSQKDASAIAHGTAVESAAGSAGQEQLLVRTATMLLRVEDINKTLNKIRDAVSTYKGQIDDLQVTTEDQGPIYYGTAESGNARSGGEAVPLNAYVTVRVPSDKLADFTKRVAALGTVLRESANQSDVTQQHIDMEARLKNLRAEEARLREFLDAATNVKDMLAVETELSRVRGEIEAMQSQLDYLDKQVAYGTLTVELQKPAPVVRPTGTDWGFGDAITTGIRTAVNVLRSTLTILIALSPIILAGLVFFILLRWILRRSSRKRAERIRAEYESSAPSPERVAVREDSDTDSEPSDPDTE